MRIRDAIGPGKNGSPDRLHMIRVEDAHHSRQVLLFTLTVPGQPAQLLCLLIYRPTEEAGASGRRIWRCATFLCNTTLEALASRGLTGPVRHSRHAGELPLVACCPPGTARGEARSMSWIARTPERRRCFLKHVRAPPAHTQTKSRKKRPCGMHYC